jgi:hypothetical protein
MICTNGCSHRYEGEEKFMALNVAVKVDSLNESLNQFVKGEALEGTNAVRQTDPLPPSDETCASSISVKNVKRNGGQSNACASKSCHHCYVFK